MEKKNEMPMGCSDYSVPCETECTGTDNVFKRLNITKPAYERIREIMDVGGDYTTALQECVSNGTAYFE